MKLGQKVTVKNEDQSLEGIVVCITLEDSDPSMGDTLLYFEDDQLNALCQKDISKLNITFCVEDSTSSLYTNIYESVPQDELQAIDSIYFTNDKKVINFGWVYKKYIVEENEVTKDDDLKFKIIYSNRICNRCRNNFSQTVNGEKICFRCGLYSSDPIYNQSK